MLPYLARLGISHVYLSPIFVAAPGSTHGYDVTDHNRVNPEIGGLAGLLELGEALVRFDMGLVLDIVPNHVGVAGGANPWWRSVLQFGEASPYAAWFDIDWQGQPQIPSGTLILPVLGRPIGRALEAGELQLALDGGELVVRYFDNRFPLRPESYPQVLGLPPLELHNRISDPAAIATCASLFEDLAAGDHGRAAEALVAFGRLLESEPPLAAWAADATQRANGTPGDSQSFDTLDALLSAQHYRLADWRIAGAEVNYRRFFDQNSLAAIRVEREDVFAETHRLLFDLAARGIVTAVRVDHIDGLYAPGDYLGRLARGLREASAAIPGAEIPVFVEKILQGDESLPPSWHVAGTTGYDFLAHCDRLFIDPAGARETTRTYEQFAGPFRYETVRYEAKRQVARSAFAGEISVLATQLHRLAQRSRLHRDNTLRALRDAVETALACFPVYRTYDGADERDEDEAAIDAALAEAMRRNRSVAEDAVNFLRETLMPPDSVEPGERELRTRFRRRFQQISGPVVAKGTEDTAFFRFNRLLSLNEVGNDPAAFGIEPGALHAWLASRAASAPYAMNASSTHDTKRSEAVRARISVLSEIPRDWRREVLTWSRLNERHLQSPGGERAPSPNLEYYLYQTLLGCWPRDGVSAELRGRMAQHLVKAMRETKQRTSWERPDAEYEAACLAFLAAILDRRKSAAFLRRLDAFAARIRPAADLHAAAALVLKCMAPGFPDFYQGGELPDFSFTDPDNRRPVDFARRERALAGSRCEHCQGPDLDDDATWLWLTRTLLETRDRNYATLTDGSYAPLDVRGEAANHAFAFTRGDRLAVVVPRLCARLMQPGGELGPAAWRDTVVSLPPGRWRNVLCTGQWFESTLPMAALAARLPIAVLERE